MGEHRIELMPLSEIKGWTRNPKEHDLARLEESLDRFGFIAPLILDEKTGRIVAGHGRLDALKARLGKGLPPPQRVTQGPSGEWLVPVLRGITFENERQAEAYLLADNRLVEAGGWDEASLLSMLKDISVDGFEDALKGIGWELGDIDALSAFTALNSGPLPGAGTDGPDPEGYVTPDTRARVIIVCPDWDTAKKIVTQLGGTYEEGRVTYDSKGFKLDA